MSPLKPFQVLSNPFKSFLILSNPFKSFQILSNPFKSFQILSSPFKSFQILSNPLKLCHYAPLWDVWRSCSGNKHARRLSYERWEPLLRLECKNFSIRFLRKTDVRLSSVLRSDIPYCFTNISAFLCFTEMGLNLKHA